MTLLNKQNATYSVCLNSNNKYYVQSSESALLYRSAEEAARLEVQHERASDHGRTIRRESVKQKPPIRLTVTQKV